MKRLYIAPQVEADQMETASMIAVSLGVFNGENDEFVGDGEFLSRESKSIWDDTDIEE